MQYITLHLEEFHRIRPMRNISSTCTGRWRKHEFIGISISRKKLLKIMFTRTQCLYMPKQHVNFLDVKYLQKKNLKIMFYVQCIHPNSMLLILRMGRIRWNSSKCRVMYFIGYHVQQYMYLLVIFMALWLLILFVLQFYLSSFILVCIFIATLRKRISWQYRCASTCTLVFVHPWVPSERCKINRNIDQGLIYGV